MIMIILLFKVRGENCCVVRRVNDGMAGVCGPVVGFCHQSLSLLKEWILLSLLPENRFEIQWFISGKGKRQHFSQMLCVLLYFTDGCGLNCDAKYCKCDPHFQVYASDIF